MSGPQCAAAWERGSLYGVPARLFSLRLLSSVLLGFVLFSSFRAALVCMASYGCVESRRTSASRTCTPLPHRRDALVALEVLLRCGGSLVRHVLVHPVVDATRGNRQPLSPAEQEACPATPSPSLPPPLSPLAGNVAGRVLVRAPQAIPERSVLPVVVVEVDMVVRVVGAPIDKRLRAAPPSPHPTRSTDMVHFPATPQVPRRQLRRTCSSVGTL